MNERTKQFRVGLVVLFTFMAASLLTEEPLRLTNMPRLADTRFLGKLLQRLGTEVVESDGPDGAERGPGRARQPELSCGLADRAHARRGGRRAGAQLCAGEDLHGGSVSGLEALDRGDFHR